MGPLVQGFKTEFDRFFGYQKKQIADCPEEIWKKKSGGFYFWQQHLHCLYCMALFAAGENEPEPQIPFSRGVAMLTEEPQGSMSKAEMLAFADKMEAVAYAFMNSLSDADLAGRNERMSKTFKRDCINQSVLIALVRHCCYHLGCCDSVLREHGLPGVY